MRGRGETMVLQVCEGGLCMEIRDYISVDRVVSDRVNRR